MVLKNVTFVTLMASVFFLSPVHGMHKQNDNEPIEGAPTFLNDGNAIELQKKFIILEKSMDDLLSCINANPMDTESRLKFCEIAAVYADLLACENVDSHGTVSLGDERLYLPSNYHVFELLADAMILCDEVMSYLKFQFLFSSAEKVLKKYKSLDGARAVFLLSCLIQEKPKEDYQAVLEKFIEDGDSDLVSETVMGWMYKNGEGVNKDPLKSYVKYYGPEFCNALCSRWNDVAPYVYQMIYEDKIKDQNKLHHVLRIACDLDNDTEKVAKLLENVCCRDIDITLEFNLLLLLSSLYEGYFGSDNKNPEKAIKWLREAEFVGEKHVIEYDRFNDSFSRFLREEFKIKTSEITPENKKDQEEGWF